jgi:hypothetical protein
MTIILKKDAALLVKNMNVMSQVMLVSTVSVQNATTILRVNAH